MRSNVKQQRRHLREGYSLSSILPFTTVPVATCMMQGYFSIVACATCCGLTLPVRVRVERPVRHHAHGASVVLASPVPLGFTEVATLHLLLLILEEGHSSLHSQKAKLPVERLFARDRIQDDLLVTA